LLNLFILSSSTPVSRLQARHKPRTRSQRIRREVIAPSLRVDHQQVKRHCWIMVEINDADPASFAAARATPPDFANATASRDQIAGLGVSRYEIDELEPRLRSKARWLAVMPKKRLGPSERSLLQANSIIIGHPNRSAAWPS
jgi:hypothetical protein